MRTSPYATARRSATALTTLTVFAALSAIAAPAAHAQHAGTVPHVLRSCACYAPSGGPSAGPTSGSAPRGPSSFVASPLDKWGAPVAGTPGGTITFSFATTSYAYAERQQDGSTVNGSIVPLDGFMPGGYKDEIRRAFAAWSSVANIQFVEVADNGAAFNSVGGLGDIRIGGHDMDGQFGVLAHGYFPGSQAGGDIHFDTGELWEIGFGGDPNGFDIFQVAAHEIGHAIGLDHEVDEDQGGPDTEVLALMNPYYTEAFSGLRADDVAGARFLYGTAPVTAAAAVPEPGTLALAGLPLVGVFGAALRRRRRAA